MRICVVIPMWNQLELTLRCLDSLRTLTPAPADVVVVDNGSWPDPRAALDATWPSLAVVRLATNRGFAGGCNAGIRQALTLGADAVLLLNNDATVEPGLLAQLTEALAQDHRIAAVGAKTLTDETPPRIHAAYGVLTFHGSLVRVEGWLEPDIEKFNRACDVDSVSGGAMLIRCAAFAAVGLFDEEFFAYHEDVDWCTRARRAGWRIRYEPAARVRHRMHASTGGGYGSPITYLAARNSVRFVRKNATARQAVAFLVYTFGNLAKEFLYRWRTGELGGLRLRVRGLWDGLRSRPVPLAELGLATPPHGSARAPA